VAIVIESICDRVDSNSWTVPTSRQFVDTEHPGRRSQFPVGRLGLSRWRGGRCRVGEPRDFRNS